MKNIIGIRREDLDKRGEQRAALAPALVRWLCNQEIQVLLQPAAHPETGELKRGFDDAAYENEGALIREDISASRVIFGLKEIDTDTLMPEKAYLCFSHTHKGQVKNLPMLQQMIEKKITLIDYELIVNAQNQRLLTAFTYFAGYAGIIESLWALSRKWLDAGISSPFLKLPRPTALPDLGSIRELLRKIGQEIVQNGTPADCPPMVIGFLGNGKTSTGAQELLDLLPVELISEDELPRVWAQGDRRKIYKMVLSIPHMFRFKAGDPESNIQRDEEFLSGVYLKEPQRFESSLDMMAPYVTMWMNCVYWSPAYPRLITYGMAESWYRNRVPLQVVGDISCDPEGAIQFSRETWPDDPTFVYHPVNHTYTPGYAGDGFALMGVTNLPCEFPADASRRFSSELEPLIDNLVSADFDAPDVATSGLVPALSGATILWKGEFTPQYRYMADFLQKA